MIENVVTAFREDYVTQADIRFIKPAGFNGPCPGTLLTRE